MTKPTSIPLPTPDPALAPASPAIQPRLATERDTLRAHLATHLAGQPPWQRRLQLLDQGACALHLAVFREPFLEFLQRGHKTVESRFTRVRCAPYGQIAVEDLVVVKRAAGPVVGVFIAGPTRSFELAPGMLSHLQAQLSEALCATDPAFWADRADCRYATLVEVAEFCGLPSLPFARRDRRGWVRLTSSRNLDADQQGALQ